MHANETRHRCRIRHARRVARPGPSRRSSWRRALLCPQHGPARRTRLRSPDAPGSRVLRAGICHRRRWGGGPARRGGVQPGCGAGIGLPGTTRSGEGGPGRPHPQHEVSPRRDQVVANQSNRASRQHSPLDLGIRGGRRDRRRGNGLRHHRRAWCHRTSRCVRRTGAVPLSRSNRFEHQLRRVSLTATVSKGT